MARHFLKMAGSHIQFRASFDDRPHVISGHPFGLEFATQPVNNCRGARVIGIRATWPAQLELELIQTQMAQKPMLRAEVGMRVRCADKASAE